MPLSATTVGLGDYRKHLELMLGWIESFPGWPSADSHLDTVVRELTHDLETANLLIDDSRPARAPGKAVPKDGHGEQSRNAFWGFAYVLHGSRLGNQVLYRRWANALAPHPLRHLCGSGNDTLSHWQRFLERLEQNVVTEQAMEEASVGAVTAFEELLRMADRQRADPEAA